MQAWKKYALTGAAAGVPNGLFGTGGGMLLVPLLKKSGNIEQARLFPTSLAIMLPMSAVSLSIYLRSGAIELRSALPFVISGVLGGITGGLLLHRVSPKLLHRVFGLLILYAGVRMLLC